MCLKLPTFRIDAPKKRLDHLLSSFEEVKPRFTIITLTIQADIDTDGDTSKRNCEFCSVDFWSVVAESVVRVLLSFFSCSSGNYENWVNFFLIFFKTS